MAKMMKLYRIDLATARGLNIAHFNPTCKAILKAMYKIEKAHVGENYSGSTGDQILSFAVDHGLWSTRQEPSKYHTTWAYYVKKLKNEAGIYESSSVRGPSTEEFLEDDEEFLDEPSDTDFDESGDEDTEEDEAEIQQMAAE